MSDQNLDYATIRRNIDKKVARQKWNYRIGFFIAHLLFYIVSMLIMWRTVALDPLAIVPAIMWGMVLLFHVASLYFESSAGEKAMRKQLLMREVGDDILKMGNLDDSTLEKPKRSAASVTNRLRLSDDGELVPANEFERLEQTDLNSRADQARST